MLKLVVRWASIGVVAAFVTIQAVPYGRNHTNPPVRGEPAWDSPQTRELTVRACFDCHSNETVWPWYSNIAPLSWLIQSDVDEGRKKVNYSEWNRLQKEAKESAETVQEGEMPPWYYAILHPEARLSSSERQALIRGLEATFGGKEEEKEGEKPEEDEEHDKEKEHGSSRR
jgi:hypothetical protein